MVTPRFAIQAFMSDHERIKVRSHLCSELRVVQISSVAAMRMGFYKLICTRCFSPFCPQCPVISMLHCLRYS